MSSDEWNAALVAFGLGIAATLLGTWIKERLRLTTETKLHKRKADADFEAAERKKLRDKIGEYRGQLVEAATDFNYRLQNLSNNIDEPWLDKGGSYRGARGEHHYFRSTVYRFAVLMSLANRFERDAHHIDERYSEDKDLAFLLYAKAFRWVMTDVALFKGIDYDPSDASDHFFTDRLREMCSALDEGPRTLRFDEFESRVDCYEFQDALAFFDGLPTRDLAWDRVVALRLVVQAFINTFGYAHQRNKPEHMEEVARSLRHPRVAQNLAFWLHEKLGLQADAEANALVGLLTKTAPAKSATADSTAAIRADNA